MDALGTAASIPSARKFWMAGTWPLPLAVSLAPDSGMHHELYFSLISRPSPRYRADPDPGPRCLCLASKRHSVLSVLRAPL